MSIGELHNEVHQSNTPLLQGDGKGMWLFSGETVLRLGLEAEIAYLWDIGHIDAVAEGQEPISEGPFIHADRLGTSGVSKFQHLGCLSNELLLLIILISMLDVPENVPLLSLDG
ncbi:hypothetical protein C0989_011821 [Termitomyces sp. Mn162]|nr:hypothetical protein C0989_011821 [Termitomyces sp. Mn162]